MNTLFALCPRLPRRGAALLALLPLFAALPLARAADPGDVNASGVINQVDVAIIKDHLIERAPLTGDALSRADANQDGKVDLEDVAYAQSRFSPAEIAPNVIVVDSTADLTAIDWTSPTLILDWAGAGGHGMDPGDIVVGSDFDGFLCRIVSISESGSILTIQTTGATLAEVITNGRVSALGMPLGPPKLGSARVRAGQRPKGSAGLDPVEWDLSGTVLYQDNVVTIDLPAAAFRLDPMVDIDFAIESSRLKYFRAEAGGDFTIDLTARVNAQIQTDWSKEIPIPGTQFRQVYVQFVGVLPVVEVVTFELVAKADLTGDAFASVEPGFTYTLPVRVGAEYYQGVWRELRGPRPPAPVGRLRWQASGDVDVRVAVAPTISVELYALAGPNFAIEPYLAFSGDFWGSPLSCSYYLDGGVDANLGFRFGILDRTFIDREFGPWNLYNARLLSGTWTPPAVGTIAIDVTPNAASWALTGPAGFSTRTGAGDRAGASAIAGAPAGDYTLTCNDNVSGYNPPPAVTRTLASGGFLRFEPVYSLELRSGTIQIDVFPNAGRWTLSGPAGFTAISGTGDRLGANAIRNAPPGPYTLTCSDNVPGFNPPAAQTRALAAGATLIFSAAWTPEGGPQTQTIYLPGDVPLVLVRIPAGSFQMGSPDTERSRLSYEGPVHTVNIAYDFYMGKTELTQCQWLAVMNSWPGTAPSSYYGVGDDYPAYYISWNDCQNFITALNTHVANTGQGPATFRLPSEAEWEYACRAGTQTRFFFGDSLTVDDYETDGPAGTLPGNRSDYMWFGGNNSLNGSKPVGTKLPNQFGLYDMSGNMWEWCQDYWHGIYTGAPADGSAWLSPTSSSPVLRGGFWGDYAYFCRSANRFVIVRPSADDRGYGVSVRFVWTQ